MADFEERPRVERPSLKVEKLRTPRVGPDAPPAVTPPRSAQPSPPEEFHPAEAAKNFGQGFVSPVTMLVSSKRGAVLGTTAIVGAVLLVVAAPKIAVVLTAAGLVYGAYLIGKGTLDAVSEYRAGKMRKSEAAFKDIGEGVGTVALAAVGARGSAAAAGLRTNSVAGASVASVKEAPKIALQVAREVKSGEAKRNLVLTALKVKESFRAPERVRVTPIPSEPVVMGDEGGGGFYPRVMPPEPPSVASVVAKKAASTAIDGFSNAPPLPNPERAQAVRHVGSVASEFLPPGGVQALRTPANQLGASQGVNELDAAARDGSREKERSK